MTIGRITKRDGREAPFDKAKIEAAVRKAQAAVGEDDARYCRDVADVVELMLERRFPRAGEPGGVLPGIEEIQDLVEQALVELGHAAVAKAYILYRDRRARAREALQVRDDEAAPRDVVRLRVRESGAVGRWSKERIVAALVGEADLSRALAERVAAAVERRVFDSGLARISTGLIRELVDNELVEMGLARALERQGPVAVPRHDLRGLCDDPGFRAPEIGGARTARGLEEALAGELLRRYVLSDALDERAAELHLGGDLQLVDLARPERDLVRSLPCELVAPGRGAEAAFALLPALARELGQVSAGLVLEDVALEAALLAREGEHALERWVLALCAAAQAAGARVDLLPFGERGQRERASTRERQGVLALAQCLERVEPGAGGATPRLFVESADLELLLADDPAQVDLVERLFGAGLVIPFWQRGEERFAGPGCRRARGERGAVACAGAVALNLPRLAREAGPWREERFLEGLCELVELALDALASLARFQGRRGAPRRGVAARAGHAVSPVGLREALRWLGDGELRPEQGARVLGVLDDALRRGARRRGLSACVSPYFGEAARARFAALDAERFQTTQGLLFQPQGAPGDPRSVQAPLAYSSGFDLALPHAGSTRSAGEGEGELVATLRSGALVPLPLARRGTRALGLEHELVTAWRRCEERRRLVHEREPARARPSIAGSEGDQAREPVLSFDPKATP